MRKQKTFVQFGHQPNALSTSGRDVSPNPLAELSSHVSKAAMLIELYEKHANSEIKTESDLDHAQREMKVIKGEILSELARSKGALELLQSPNRLKAIGPSRSSDLGEAKG